jgi:hypothetical protein
MICGFMHYTGEKSSISHFTSALTKPMRHSEEITQREVDYYSLQLEDLLASLRRHLKLDGEQQGDNE